MVKGQVAPPIYLFYAATKIENLCILIEQSVLVHVQSLHYDELYS